MLVWQKDKLPDLVSRVLEELVPGVFSMTEDEQVAAWRDLKLNGTRKVEDALRREIGAPRTPMTSLDGGGDKATPGQKYALHGYKLHIFGHGPDRVCINELSYDQDRTERDFGTLLDFCKFRHECQSRYLTEEQEDSPNEALEATSFKPEMYGDWLRCFDKEELTYVFAYTADAYIATALVDAALGMADELISTLNQHVEEQLVAFAMDYCNRAKDSLYEEFSNAPGTVSWLSHDGVEKFAPQQQNKLLILKNAEALRGVRFDSFISDIHRGQKEEVDFGVYVERLRADLKVKLEAKYQELIAADLN